MISDIINIVTSLPSQHVIYGMISTVLCIAVAWVYGKCSQKIRLTILQAIGYLVVFNEVVFQIYMIYYGIWSPSSSLPLEMCYISALLIPVYAKNQNNRTLKTGSILQGLVDRYLHLSIQICQRWSIYMFLSTTFLHMVLSFLLCLALF